MGALGIAVGLGAALAAIRKIGAPTGYGPLQASSTMRLFIPAVTLWILGSHGSIFASFFLSILGLKRR